MRRPHRPKPISQGLYNQREDLSVAGNRFIGMQLRSLPTSSALTQEAPHLVVGHLTVRGETEAVSTAEAVAFEEYFATRGAQVIINKILVASSGSEFFPIPSTSSRLQACLQ